MAARAETMEAVPVVAAARVPWYIWCSVVAVTSAMIGAHWDISWHRSIGRDTFWTPAHIAIYACGVLAGISCGYLILRTTFSGSLGAASVKMWGFRGPLGAFIAAWGGVAMLTSAPFDDWWHSAYGLDVKILSPPHVVLILGILAIELGALILILGYMNRAEGKLRDMLDWLFLYTGGMILVLMMVMTMEHTIRIFMHSAQFYRTVALAVPIVLAGVARASGQRWATTAVTGFYTAMLLGCQWILPLFAAEPKLGPVMNPVTHFIPPQFPLLLLVPAVALDLLWPKVAGMNKWVQALASGVAFMTIFLAVQWFFADFLMSKAAHNWFFGSQYRDYGTGPTSFDARGLYLALEKTASAFWINMALAFGIAVLMMRLGISWGEWMRRIRR